MINEKIFVLGGGGFSMEPENSLLDQYLLSLVEKKRPKICFIPTASADSEEYTARFQKGFNRFECETSAFSLFRPPSNDIESYLLEKDIFFVGGGNTKNLLCLWREWGVDKILKTALAKGKVLSGVSAGMICWYEQGLTDSFGNGSLAALDCLGFLQGSACPHYNGEFQRQSCFEGLIATKKMKNGIALDDSAGALYLNGELKEVVSSVQGSNGYLITEKQSQAEKHILKSRFLGKETL